MNAALRTRAEALLLFQEYGGWTDSQTLRAATILAHHGKQFSSPDAEFASFFPTLAAMFREKFPECPCWACRRT
jgi:hypothetical protein